MSTDQINQAVEVLRNGGVIAYPTDTYYGLGADATNNEAIAKLVRIKGRQEEKPFSLLFSDVNMIKRFTDLPRDLEVLLNRYLPGAYTFIIPYTLVTGSPSLAISGQTIGVRLPNFSFALDLVRTFDKPITATSANLAGSEPLNSLSELTLLKVDFICWQGPLPPSDASTIVDLTVNPPAVLRRGAGPFPLWV